MPTGFVKRRADGEKVWLYTAKSRARSARARDVRWGDFLNIEEQFADGWSRIKWGSKRYFLLSENIADARPLEVIFLDVGQGDGCLLVSPETETGSGAAPHLRERIIVIDAGLADNMLGFIKWRFGKLRRRFPFHAAVVTHPDGDHYRGFQKIFAHPNVAFDKVYHNGIMERTGDDLLGPTDASGRYLAGLTASDAEVRSLYGDAQVRGRKHFPKLIHTAMTSGRVGAIEMLSTRHGETEGGRSWMPGFAPASGRSTTIEVVGPVAEADGQGRARLRWFGDTIGSQARSESKTKNGHSVLLRLCHNDFTLLFGGDLNRPAEDFLLRHYGGIADDAPLREAVAGARARLGADVMKSCHHGSADVTDELLQAVNPFAFVISSGDEESYAHPRPDLLGRLGKHGRGAAPLILATEILRSTREKGKADEFRRLRSLDRTIDAAATSAEERRTAQRQRRALQRHIEKRNVGVYGAITVRTDGAHMEISFRLERPRGKQLWQSYWFAFDAANGWQATAGGD